MSIVEIYDYNFEDSGEDFYVYFQVVIRHKVVFSPLTNTMKLIAHSFIQNLFKISFNNFLYILQISTYKK